MEVNVVEIFPYVWWYAILATCYAILSYWIAGDWIKVSLIAWYKKKPIMLEWTKTKKWVPFVGDVLVTLPHIIKLDNDRGIVRLRREASGTGSNKIPMLIFASENVNTINPVEFGGETYYKPELVYAEEIEEANPITGALTKRWQTVKLKDFDKEKEAAGLYHTFAKYPITSAVAPHEFFEYQDIDDEPMMYQQYAEQQVKEELDKIKAPISTFFRDNLSWLIPLILVCALAFMWMQQNNAAIGNAAEVASCRSEITTLYQTGVCKMNPLINNTVVSAQIPSGSMIR